MQQIGERKSSELLFDRASAILASRFTDVSCRLLASVSSPSLSASSLSDSSSLSDGTCWTFLAEGEGLSGVAGFATVIDKCAAIVTGTTVPFTAGSFCDCPTARLVTFLLTGLSSSSAKSLFIVKVTSFSSQLFSSQSSPSSSSSTSSNSILSSFTSISG
eukprot:Gb_22107 [translate_table: standard]